MIDWLRPERQDPVLKVGGRFLPIEPIVHPRARRMTLRLAPCGTAVRVSYPRWGRRGDAIRFAHDRTEWIAAQLAKLPPPTDPLARGDIAFRGRRLVLRHEATAPRSGCEIAGVLTIGGPAASLPGRLERWLKTQASELMAEDLVDYCERAGVDVPLLRLSNARRRWGSCSTTGIVRVNWRLVQAPDNVRRSVVAHEVAHLVHFDHSPAFHALLGNLYQEDLTLADAWLKSHGRTLYSDFG